MATILEKLDIKAGIAEVKELIAQKQVIALLFLFVLLLFPLASLLTGLCWLILRNVGVKWVKVLAWISAGALAAWLVLRKLAFLFLMIVCWDEDADRERCSMEISKTWQSMSTEERMAYMSTEKLKQVTDIDFPEYDVIDYWDMTAWQDPSCCWVLELRDEFDKSYLDSLRDAGILEYDSSDSTYRFEIDYPEYDYADVECSDFSLRIKGTEVVINDYRCSCEELCLSNK